MTPTPKTTPASKIRWLNPDTLTEDPGNPRTITPENQDRLRQIIDKFGMVENLVLNKRTGELISGHQRRNLALELGIEKVPVMVVDLDETEAKALAIALNNPSAQGTWAPELLSIRLDELASVDALELTAFDTSELTAFGFPSETDETEDVHFTAKKGSDDAPQLPEEPETQPGDVWDLGEHRIVCGDASVAGIYDLAPGAATCVITDPPYGVNYTGGPGRERVPLINDIQGADWLVWQMLTVCARTVAPGCGLYLFAPPGPDETGFRLAIEMSPWRHRQTLVWVKNNPTFGPMGLDYHWHHESILYGHLPTGPHHYHGDRRQTTVWNFDRPATSDYHPTQKPVDLVGQMLTHGSLEGDLIVDPFLGGGSLLIAGEQLDRQIFGIELDPGYVDVAVARWRDLTGKRGRRRKGAALDLLTAETAT